MKTVTFNNNSIKIHKHFDEVNLDGLTDLFIKYADINKIKSKIPEELIPIFLEIVGLAEPNYKYTSIDFKIQTLIKGAYPCSSGWHCDGDPNPDNDLHDRYLILVSGNDCLTEFITEPVQLELSDDYQTLSKLALLKQIQNQLNTKKFEFAHVPSWTLVEYDKMNLHRCVKSLNTHKRLLIRLNQSDTIKPRRNF